MTVATRFRGPQACRIVGISYRQLDYWDRTNLVEPSIERGWGSGHQRAYSYQDLVVLRVIKTLLDAGVSLVTTRSAIKPLRSEVFAETGFLVARGNSAWLIETAEDLSNVIAGNQPFFVVSMKSILEDLNNEIKRQEEGNAEEQS